MQGQSGIKIGSNRNFGLVFFAVFLIIGLWPLINEEQTRTWSILISITFLILGILNSKLLTPLNKLWFKFGIKLGAIIAPIVMTIIFFLIVTPIGLFMRLIGKDLLKKQYDKKKKSYWIKRDNPIDTMKQQF